MPCQHEGHQDDLSHEQECACGEVVRDQAAHRCIVITKEQRP